MAAVPGETRASLREQLLRRKPVAAMTAETGADTGKGELQRSIGLFQLTAFGVGATIGTGIFIVLTQAVPVGGPATILSFVFAGTVAGLTAICYAELASTVPVSGSSYSYAYATLGEGVAIVVAACLLLEYGVGVRRGRGRLVAVPERAARQRLRVDDPRRPVERAGAGWRVQPSRGDPGRAVLAAADSRCQRVGEGQHRHGDDQDAPCSCCSSSSGCRAGTRTTCPTSRRSACLGSARRPASSSSPTSGSTRSRRPARRCEPASEPAVGDPHRAHVVTTLYMPSSCRGHSRAAHRRVRGAGGRTRGDPRARDRLGAGRRRSWPPER